MAIISEQDTHGRTKETPQHGTPTGYAHCVEDSPNTVTSPYYVRTRTVHAKYIWTLDTTPA